jgi:hypothetical protein
MIDFGQVFSHSWRICTENLGQCLLAGLAIIGVLIGMQIIAQVSQFVGAVTGSIFVMLALQLVVFVVNLLVQVGIQLGLWNFGIKMVRDRRGEPGDLFAFGPFLLRGILLTLLIWLITMGVMLVCGVPVGITIVALDGERAFDNSPEIIVPVIIVAVVVAAVLMTWITLRLFLAMPLIIDRNLGVMDAVSGSDTFMTGNKLTTVLVMIVAGLVASAITLFTCCLGAIFAYPYLAVVTATIYLSATGQPLQLGVGSYQR